MTLAIFHPAFETVGGAEILVAAQASYLKRAGLDVRVTTLALDAARWRNWFDGIPVRLVPKPPWSDVFCVPLKRLERAAARAEGCLRDCTTVLASNFPANVMLGASSIGARRVWYCTEPARHWHLVATNPRLHARVTSAPGGETDAERTYARKLASHERALSRPSNRAREIAFDIEKTNNLDAVYAISEFGRDNVRRVYGRTDVEVIYPIVRVPAEPSRARAGLDRTGLKILTHSRLEIPKNVDNVVRGFALLLPKVPGSQLHVVGEGTQRKNLERLVRRLGIGSSVWFHGYLPDKELDAVYDACDVFALQPLDEPFGLVFPEAAARGILLVGPDHGGPFEILDGGRLGWVSDPFSSEALAETFLRIWALPDADVDARRVQADRACRSRYSEAVIGPQLLRALADRSSAAASGAS